MQNESCGSAAGFHCLFYISALANDWGARADQARDNLPDLSAVPTDQRNPVTGRTEPAHDSLDALGLVSHDQHHGPLMTPYRPEHPSDNKNGHCKPPDGCQCCLPPAAIQYGVRVEAFYPESGVRLQRERPPQVRNARDLFPGQVEVGSPEVAV